MIIVGVVYGVITGNIDKVGNGAVMWAEEAVKISITMLGIMSMWMGFMNIAEKSGLVKKCEKVINPLINWLFPNLPCNHSARPHIITNIIANVKVIFNSIRFILNTSIFFDVFWFLYVKLKR